MVKRKNKKHRQVLLFALTFILSVVYIFVGRNIAMQGFPDLFTEDVTSVTAKVTEIVERESFVDGEDIFFSAKLLRGENAGEVVQVVQTIRTNVYPVQEPVEAGDRVLIYVYNGEDTDWTMLEYLRSNSILWLGIAFAFAVIAFGGWKGISTMVSLAFTVLAVFAVFVPSVLSGQNIYVWSAVTCVYVIIMTMLFINGADKKSLVAGLGCAAGVALAGLIALVMNMVMKLTGMTDEETLYLTMLETKRQIDLNGIVFASIVIGALGAVMDVAMDISSSLNELHINAPSLNAHQLFASGCTIGKDVMGTMANTLVLAYIGSSLCTTLLLMVYNVSALELFNTELVITELLQALAGSFGMLLAIPVTALISSAIYTKSAK